MSSDDSYTRDELRNAEGLPERGDLCHQCGVNVPQFADMDDELYQRLVHLIDRQRGLMAMRELATKLECPDTFAKIWVTHRGKAKPTYPEPWLCRANLGDCKRLNGGHLHPFTSFAWPFGRTTNACMDGR